MIDLRQVLAELAYAAEFETVLQEGSPALRAALDAAWDALGPDARDGARLRRGCMDCRGPLSSPESDFCRPCGDVWREDLAAIAGAYPVGRES